MADAKPPAVKRAVFYDIYPGDRLKLDAKSNIAKSGGGARDFRFSPQEEFIPVFGEILKGRLIRVTHGKKVGRRQVTVFTGIVLWHDPKVTPPERSGPMLFWPANQRRKTEARIGTVHRLGLSHLVKNDPNGGKSVFLLLELADGSARVWFTTETSLRNDKWHPSIKAFATRWMDGGAKSGFIDLVTGTEFANGGS